MQPILKKKHFIIACVISLIGCAVIADRLSNEPDESANYAREIVDEGYFPEEVSFQDEQIIVESSNAANQTDDINIEKDDTSYISDADMPLSDLETDDSESVVQFDYSFVPDYTGTPSIIINNNNPYFTDEDRKWEPGLEVYPPVDELDRCGTVYACLGKETMPAEGEERGSIGMVKPSGWQTIKYPDIIEDLYLYNRCHLIGWQLGGENDNEYNLITGTRYLNVSGMLQYEDQVACYLKNTGNHVLYRVTPLFIDDELVARGVLMEAESVEDSDLCFCVWCYNVQPGIEINYLTGDSRVAEQIDDLSTQTGEMVDLVLNTNTMRAHLTDCSSIQDIKPENRMDYHGTIEDVQNMGYVPCGNCHPFD
jgi:DNA-entry nuclease